MKNVLVESFVDGFKDSFRLAVAIAASPIVTINKFVDHGIQREEKKQPSNVGIGQKRLAKHRK